LFYRLTLLDGPHTFEHYLAVKMSEMNYTLLRLSEEMATLLLSQKKVDISRDENGRFTITVGGKAIPARLEPVSLETHKAPRESGGLLTKCADVSQMLTTEGNEERQQQVPKKVSSSLLGKMMTAVSEEQHVIQYETFMGNGRKFELGINEKGEWPKEMVEHADAFFAVPVAQDAPDQGDQGDDDDWMVSSDDEEEEEEEEPKN